MTVRTAIGERMDVSCPGAPRFTPSPAAARPRPAAARRYCSVMFGSPRLVSPFAERTHVPPRGAPPL